MQGLPTIYRVYLGFLQFPLRFRDKWNDKISALTDITTQFKVYFDPAW